MLWEPSPELLNHSDMARYQRWLEERRGLRLRSYDELWRWSVTDLDGFWDSVWEFFQVRGRRPDPTVLADASMPGARWFPGAELNYAEHALRRLDDSPALLARTEDGPLRTVTRAELGEQVARAAAGLRRLGVGKGDRVVAYLPNLPETVVAFLAAASIGAVWSSCAPEFGVTSVIDRFQQIEPKVLVAVDGYRYGGRWHDRREHLAAIRAQLPTLAATVMVPGSGTEETTGRQDQHPDITNRQDPRTREATGRRDGRPEGPAADTGAGILTWEELLAGREAVPALAFEPVPFDHPLWVLYSSGTTGLPKAIVQGHGGILLEHLKQLSLHLDVHDGNRLFWFTTTGWMMWNFLVSGLTVGAAVVLYDGSPAAPDLDVLWRLAEDARITHFGTSAAFVTALSKSPLHPARDHDLSSLRHIGVTGSPLSPDGFRWLHDHAGKQVQVGSMSGGTDACTAFVGSSPLVPVYEGEISCRLLGAAVEAFDPDGRALTDEVGELVITRPLPSMPLRFWNDPDGSRLRDSYFDVYPGVWRHGDWIQVTGRGTCVIYGRSDSTLNRGGVRMGTAEFYRVVEAFDEIQDSLVVEVGETGGRLLLFVVLRDAGTLGRELRGRLEGALRAELSPRHVPDEIHVISSVPRTLSGKKLEVPVKRILAGTPVARAVSEGALANPDALTEVVTLATSHADA